jgi:hypothetical protein
MSQSTLSNDLGANDIDFFKKKFADFDTLDRQLKTLASSKLCPAKAKDIQTSKIK